jgi:hypothetical protein
MARLVHDYHPMISASAMLQDLLHRLSGLSSAELRGLKDAVNAELGDQLGPLDGLSAEEWDALDGSGFTGYRDCIRLVGARTGLGLVLAKEYVDDARAKGRPAAVYDGRAKGKSAAPSSIDTVENSSAGKVFVAICHDCHSADGITVHASRESADLQIEKFKELK